ncbi:MAG: 30S ribosome-binding factor RbfA [Treponema sp.]|jgi:ribosome-binding factor A|nr:30S ribosome-binding factor RbfA [Treponema sp.]
MAEYRTERVGHLIQQIISALILEGRIKDPRVSAFLSITRVLVSRDLSYADVYVSNIRAGAQIERGVEGLQNAAGFIQARLGETMRIRKIPHLRFHVDTSIREAFDMVKKIEDLAAEKPAADEGAEKRESDESAKSPKSDGNSQSSGH